MASKFTVETRDEGFKRKLAKLEALTGNMQPVYRVIGATLVNRIRLCFQLGIDPWGSPWARLKFRKGQPLLDTGRMSRSITSRADSTGVTVGTNIVQAKVHQFGATIVPKSAKRLVFPGPNGQIVFAKKVAIPARPYLPLRRDTTQVVLPPAWSLLVVNAIKRYMRAEIAEVA